MGGKGKDADKNQYIGAYYDKKNRLRPITPKKPDRKFGIPIKMSGGNPLPETREPVEEKEERKVFIVDGKPSASKYFYTPLDDVEKLVEWTEEDQARYEEYLETADEREALYDSYKELESARGELILDLLHRPIYITLKRYDEDFIDKLFNQYYYYEKPLTPKQVDVLEDKAIKYQDQIKATVEKSDGPVYIREYGKYEAGFHKDPRKPSQRAAALIYALELRGEDPHEFRHKIASQGYRPEDVEILKRYLKATDENEVQRIVGNGWTQYKDLKEDGASLKELKRKGLIHDKDLILAEGIQYA